MTMRAKDKKPPMLPRQRGGTTRVMVLLEVTGRGRGRPTNENDMCDRNNEDDNGPPPLRGRREFSSQSSFRISDAKFFGSSEHTIPVCCKYLAVYGGSVASKNGCKSCFMEGIPEETI